MAVRSMHVSESTYTFFMSSLSQLSHDIARPDFAPTDSQKIILEQAIRLLDLEVSFQVTEHPEYLQLVDQWLNAPD
ncbi:hypothetical protein GCM10027085_21840 [Spirosoma aerophilum]